MLHKLYSLLDEVNIIEYLYIFFLHVTQISHNKKQTYGHLVLACATRPPATDFMLILILARMQKRTTQLEV